MSHYNRRPRFNKKNSQENSNNFVALAAEVGSSNEARHGFNLYFPESGSSNIEETLGHILAFEKFIQRNGYSFESVETNKFFLVDYKLIINDKNLCNEWKELGTDLVSHAEHCLRCMGLAMHQCIVKSLQTDNNDVRFNTSSQVCYVHARLINYDPVEYIKNIGAINFGKIISVRGTVIKAGNVRLEGQYLAFKCSTCGATQLVKQIDEISTLPVKCISETCNAKSKFKHLVSLDQHKTVDAQCIRIQEAMDENTERETGKIPKTLECEFKEDLVNSCFPGDDITVVGILKLRNDSSSRYQQNCVHSMYVDVISVINNKNEARGNCGASERIKFDKNDLYAIEKIHGEPNLFRLLVYSLCPHICGHEIVKAGLLLALLGGSKSSKRCESHVLMVGDPGLGKSTMLQAGANVSPRGAYVCGTSSTTSGLTVALTREGRGDYTLEAGALMLADQGCCCIDEFDKMPLQHDCLLEAMEHQSISIAKSGIACTLPTRATILAAANPSGGHYNKARTVAENLKLPAPLLSRFDLIFILVDKRSMTLDVMISENTLARRAGKNVSSLSKTFQSAASMLNESNVDKKEDLRNLLMVNENEEHLTPLPHNLLSKYIAYAQTYVNPIVSQEAADLLTNFYLKLRKDYQDKSSTPITTRQLFSLFRLTQARAKAELRKEATESDAADVIEIMECSLKDILDGVEDQSKSQRGGKNTTKKQIVALLNLIQQSALIESRTIFTKEELRDMCGAVGIEENKRFSVLESLNTRGYILKKSGNEYQFITAEL